LKEEFFNKMGNRNKIIKTCPLCKSYSFYQTDELVNIPDILNKWEIAISRQFPPEVWAEYSLHENKTTSLFLCANCDFGIYQPAIAGSNLFYKTVTQDEYYNSVKWEFLQAARDIKKNNYKTLLDIGCGEGAFLDLIKNRVPSIELFGYEINTSAADTAKNKGYRIFDSDIFKNNDNIKFDVITVFQVIEHLKNPIEFLISLRKLLNKDGILIISAPNSRGPISYFNDSLTELPPHHLSKWSSKSFLKGMKNIDYTVLKIEYEPLPSYLWDSYLPVIWEKSWPSDMIEINELSNNEISTDKNERMARFVSYMKKVDMRWLWGVQGHTIYTILKNKVDAFVEQLEPDFYDKEEELIKREDIVFNKEREFIKKENYLNRYSESIGIEEARVGKLTEEMNKKEIEFNNKHKELIAVFDLIKRIRQKFKKLV
jgi:SAM-dependent methyltransferase